MEEKIDFKEMQKKEVRIGVRVSLAERALLNDFCKKNGVLISDFIRYSIRKVMNDKQAK